MADRSNLLKLKENYEQEVLVPGLLKSELIVPKKVMNPRPVKELPWMGAETGEVIPRQKGDSIDPCYELR